MLNELRQMIKEGVDVNYTPVLIDVCYDPSPLAYAAKLGNTQAMRVLIDAGADVNAAREVDQPCAGYPVLRDAIDSKNIDAVKMLLAAGAKVNVATVSGLWIEGRPEANERNMYLLAYLIQTRQPIELIKLFIQAGAKIEQKAIFGDVWRPLMVAAHVGYTEAVKVLLKAGANAKAVSARDGNRTALDYAREAGHTDIVALLESYISSKCWFF